ncbi:hypothetical protein C8F04DRAFT_331292 [Mycena alexandri]|uniref:F-box domain-containing protein n=1 Tax=Mycena alexandri TaxID=1745969 RepID=A0AAD6T4X2_9AGAR|nr:hypothetical protein C8F04DRAFT_331292 [Mycena alexandri]
MSSILEAERIRVAEWDAQIMDLERALSAARAQRALIQKRLDSYKYPVLTLPTEMVSEIFVHFLPVYPECPPFDGILSPTNLTHICRKWREVALATPRLWRAIRFCFPPQLDAFDLWLGRSGCCPISVGIGPYESLTRPRFSSSRCARWEHLRLESPILIESAMPLLRHLKIEFGDDYSFNPVLFRDVPLLQSVFLNHYAAISVTLPWAQLTSVVLDTMYPFECAPILQQTSNLTHCKLMLAHLRRSGLPDITLPRLESLTVIGCNNSAGTPSAIVGYLDTFIVPALRGLDILEEYLEDPVHSLTTLISKSGCRPQKVSILGNRRVSKDTYCGAFPAIQFSFDGRCGLDEIVSPNVEAL